MQNDQAKILIVDDNSTFGKACVEMAKRSHLSASWAKSPNEALEKAQADSFDAILIDCMLPKKPGIELAQELKPICSEQTVFLLMSGIYKDKNFIREALQKTQADGFLTKPFSLEEFQTHLAALKKEEVATEEVDPIPQLFASQTLRARKIIEAIDASDNINGFELPFIYSLFLTANITGQMNIAEADGRLFGVTFSEGKIVSVETDDPPTILGELLLEKNLIDKEELEFEMAKADEETKIGQRLIKANLLSPHMLDEILIEQMEIRLANTVLDTSIEVNFVESEEIPPSAGIDLYRFSFLLCKWFTDRIPVQWLENYYLSWLDHKIDKGVRYSETHPMFETTPFIYTSEFAEDLFQAGTIHNLLQSKKYSEEDILLRVHLLMITRNLGFGAVAQEKNYDRQKERAQKTLSELQKKDYFQALNLSKNAKEVEVQRAYKELVKVFSSEGFESDTPQDLKDLHNEITAYLTKVYETLSDPEQKQKYLNNIRQKNAQQILVSESLLEQGKSLLTTGQASQAMAKFNEALELNKGNSDLVAYRVWTKIKLLKQGPNYHNELQEIERDISELSQNSQQSPLIHFIKGLLQKEKGHAKLAQTQFENAISLDSQFLEARRELNVLKLQQKKDKSVDILRGDLKDVVGMLFRRK